MQDVDGRVSLPGPARMPRKNHPLLQATSLYDMPQFSGHRPVANKDKPDITTTFRGQTPERRERDLTTFFGRQAADNA